MTLPDAVFKALLLLLFSSRPNEMAPLALQPPHADGWACSPAFFAGLRFLQQPSDPGLSTGFARKALGSQCHSDILQLLSSPALRGTFDGLGGLASPEACPAVSLTC